MWKVLFEAERKLHDADRLIHDILRPTLDDLSEDQDVVVNAFDWSNRLEKLLAEPFDRAIAKESKILEIAATLSMFGPYLAPRQRDTIQRHVRMAGSHGLEVSAGLRYGSPSTFADGVFGLGWSLMELPKAIFGGRNRQVWRTTAHSANDSFTRIWHKGTGGLARVERRKAAIEGVDEAADLAVYAKQVLLEAAKAELATRISTPPTLGAVMRYAAEVEAAVYAEQIPPVTRVEGVTKDDGRVL